VKLVLKPISLILVLTLVVAGCTTTGKREKPDRAEVSEVNMKLGAEYYQQGRLDLALERLKKAVMADPQSAQAHVMLGLVYSAMERPRQADEHYQSAVEYVSPDSATFGDVHNNYAVFLCGQEFYVDAERHFNIAAKHPLYRTPDQALENAGVCALQAGDLEKGETYLRKSLQKNPRRARALINMAELQWRKKEYLSARGYLQRFHEVSRGNPESLWLGVRVERMLGNDQASGKYARKLQKNFPDADETQLYQNSMAKSE
jgi:type IV pilus assembly protein PilF